MAKAGRALGDELAEPGDDKVRQVLCTALLRKDGKLHKAEVQQ